MTRPKRLIGILGTATDVGKTHVAAQWLAQLRRQGLRVAARKPVQSFDPRTGATDASRLAQATGEDETAVCPAHRSYPLALAPPMAADALRRPRIAIADLLEEIRWPEGIDVGVVETAGGPRSPLAHDGDSVDLVRLLRVDRVLLVADAGLGTINATRLALACLAPLPTLVFLNRYDDANELHRMNRQWLVAKYGVDAVATTAALSAIAPATEDRRHSAETLTRATDRDADRRRE